MNTTCSNSNQLNPRRHPLSATAAANSAGVQGEHRAPRLSRMQSANKEPSDIIAKVAGVVRSNKTEDDSLYFTNNEGIPFPNLQVSAAEQLN